MASASLFDLTVNEIYNFEIWIVYDLLFFNSDDHQIIRLITVSCLQYLWSKIKIILVLQELQDSVCRKKKHAKIYVYLNLISIWCSMMKFKKLNIYEPSFKN